MASPKAPRALPHHIKAVQEALDQGNVKLSLRRSEQLVERYPQSNQGRALRALTLELSGSREEALLLLHEVQRERIVDPMVLGLLRDVYVRAGMLNEVSTSYEAAVEGDPESERNAVSLFLALAYQGQRLPRLQQVALNLHRRFGKQQFLLWAVAAVMLQVRKAGLHRSLDLAEALLMRCPPVSSRSRKEDPLPTKPRDSFSILLIHIAMFRQQGKYRKALTLLEDNWNDAPLVQDAMQLQVTLLAEAGDLTAAAEAARTKFLHRMDQWSSVKEYITAVFRAEGFLEPQTMQGRQKAEHAFALSNSMAAARQKVSKAGTLDEVVISARRGGILTSQATVSNINNELTFRGAQARQKEAGVDLLDFAGRVGGAIAELACEAKAHARGRIHRHVTVGSAKVAARRHSQNRHLDAIVQEKAGDDDRRASFAESKESGSEQGEPKELSDEFWDAGDQKQSADPDRSGHQVRDAFMLFKRLQGHPEHKACRSLYLAELEMRAVAFACSESEALVRSEAAAVSTSASLGANVTWPLPGLNADFADFVEILAAYFGRFGHVGGCYTDMKPYLSLLDESRADMLMQKLEQQQATECHALQRRLTLARLRHGLRILEGAPPEELAEEVLSLLALWSEIGSKDFKSHETESEDLKAAVQSARQSPVVGSAPPPVRRAGRCHGISEEAVPTVDPEDLLCIAVVQLLELDRAYCLQKAGEAQRRTEEPVRMTRNSATHDAGSLPSLHERGYYLDALALLELGAKRSPNCARLRVLLAALYGATGAAVPMRKWCDSVGLGGALGGPIRVFSLDILRTFGAWPEMLEVCYKMQAAEKELETAAREALVAACEESGNGKGAHGIQRCREYTAALESAGLSRKRGRALVEEATVRALACSNFKALSAYLNGPAVSENLVLSAASSAPLPARGLGAGGIEEDLIALQFLNTLPRITPLQGLVLGLIGATRLTWPRARLATPHAQWYTAFRQAPLLSGAACAVAAAWPGAGFPEEEAPEIRGLSKPVPSLSGCLEEIVALRTLSSQGVLRLRAQLLLIVRAMLKQSPSEDEVSLLLSDFQAGLAEEGVALHCDPTTIIGQHLKVIPSTKQQDHSMSFERKDEPDSPRSPGRAAGWRRVKSALARTQDLDRGEPGSPGAANADELQGAKRPSQRPSTTTSVNLVLRPSSMSRKSNVKGQTQPPSTAPAVITSSAVTVASATSSRNEVYVPIEVQPLHPDDPKVGLPPPWRSSVVAAEDIFWRSAFLTCDTAHRLLQAIRRPDQRSKGDTDVSQAACCDPLMTELLNPVPGSIQSWTAIRRLLQVLRPLVRACVRSIMQEPAPICALKDAMQAGSAEAETLKLGSPFSLGGQGLPLLTGFLQVPMLVLGPTISLLASILGQAGVLEPMAPPGAIAASGSVVKTTLAGLRKQKTAALSSLAYNATKEATDAADAAERALKTAEELEAVRVAMAELNEELQVVLKELATSLLSAQWDGIDGAGIPAPAVPDQAATGTTTSAAAAKAAEDKRNGAAALRRKLAEQGVDLDKYRKSIINTLETSHRKQLSAIEKVCRGQLDLLASIRVRAEKL